jgi:HD-GYP domain-containing protein (c-di-GMP phosphodiesterase class II)
MSEQPTPAVATTLRALLESLFLAISASQPHMTLALVDGTGHQLVGSCQSVERMELPNSSYLLAWSGPDPEVAQRVAHTVDLVLAQHSLHLQQTQRMAQLSRVAALLNEANGLEELLQRILSFAQELVGAERGSLVLLDEVYSELKLLQRNGCGHAQVTTTRVEADHELKQWLVEEGQVRKPGVLGLPLQARHRVVGCLTLVRPEDFSADDVQVLQILSGHAAHAIHNVQLFAQVQRQLDELKRLQALSHNLNHRLTMEEVLEQLLSDTLHMLEAEQASVMLFEPDGETLTIKMAHGLPEEVIAQTRVKLGERISGRVAQNRQPLLYSAQQNDESGSALCVPLLKDSEVLGVLNVRHKKDGGDFNRHELHLAARFANVAALSIAKAGLHQELRLLFVHSIRALANAVDARDPYTSGHSVRVTRFAVLLAEHLGFTHEILEELRYASLLHDIGKIRISDAILHKPGRLSEEEFEEMKRHPEYGVEIMRPVTAFQSILPFMLHHHERFDGRGYPTGLSGEKIPLQARILCVADCFDAMTSDRPYRRGMKIELAAEELRRNRGSQFDPEVVDLFLHLVEEGKISDIVEPGSQTA